MTNLDNTLQKKDITLLKMAQVVKAMFFFW